MPNPIIPFIILDSNKKNFRAINKSPTNEKRSAKKNNRYVKSKLTCTWKMNDPIIINPTLKRKWFFSSVCKCINNRNKDSA